MVYALLVCSDEDCTHELEAPGTLAELEALACDCGCTLEVLSFDEAADGDPRFDLQLVR